MAICSKCGEPLSFVKRPGKYGVPKWFPVNPDGSDHWDLCKQKQRASMGMAAVMAKHPPASSRSKATYLYCYLTIPPWDESLGKFRDFTQAEKLAAIVCRRL